MASPEHSERNVAPSPTTTELVRMLDDLDRQLELADQNENTIERFYKRDQLLEQRDELQAELDTANSPSETL